MTTMVATTLSQAYLEASFSLRDYLYCLHEDLVNARDHPWEILQRLKGDLFDVSGNWSVLLRDYADVLKSMPKELKNRPLIKRMIVEIESIDKAIRRTIEENLELARSTDWSGDVVLKSLRDKVHQVALQVTVLENHTIIQKFVKGEMVLGTKKSIQWGRKLWHAFLGTFFLYLVVYSGFPKTVVWSIAGIFSVWAFGLETSRHLNPRINEWVWKFFRPIMREREKYKINSGVFYIAAMLFVYFVFPEKVAVLSMLFIALGDPIGGIVGVKWGTKKISEHVSLQGFMACFLTCFTVSFIWTGFVFDSTLSGVSLFAFSFLAGLTGAIAEGSFSKIDDNLVMPVLSAPVLWGLMALFGIL